MTTNSANITVNLNLGLGINVANAPANFSYNDLVDNKAFNFVNLSGANSFSGNTGILSPVVNNGSNTFGLTITAGTIPGVGDEAVVGNITVTFNTGIVATTELVFYVNFPDPSILQAIFTVSNICLHGSSLVETKNGLKRIDQIDAGDEVLSGPNLDEYTPVREIGHCLLNYKTVDHDAIIFEPGSLGENEPTKRLIIDPGHPMCTRKEYLEKGYEALTPAGALWEELKSDKIYTKKWTDTLVQEDPAIRYDLYLDEPYNTYVANGVVVRARGYESHRYKRFV
jgi:hypothetical protein